MFYKDYKYEDKDGNEQTIRLMALPTKYLGDLWDIQRKLTPKMFTAKEKAIYSKLSSLKEGEELSDAEYEIIFAKEREIQSQLSKDDIKVLVEFCEATLKKSKKGVTDDEIEYIVGNYFWSLYPDILSLNLKK